jgi:hypothetical protein
MGSQSLLLQALGWAILNSLWQLALLWVIYQGITTAYRSAKPAARSTLASSLLMAGFAWFIYTFFLALDGSSGSSGLITAPTNDDSLLGKLNNLVRASLPFASMIYLALLAIPLLRFTRNYRYVQVIRKYGLSKIDPEWRLFVTRISSMMGIKKPVHIYLSE